ncbi:hypothetical protein [Catenuloplanes japonicus]|uniref:hypothetical protein n=1 Tax=Catenuloplanes japonicus TaxID=33876 RepID=UPI0005248CC7|nr:hypothetical protein [Catenuloplanes japonicus]
MSRRTLVAVAGWLAAAVIATLIGMTAIRLIGESITGTAGGVLSEQDVAAAVASLPAQPSSAPPPSPTASASPSLSSSPPAVTSGKTFAVTGGTAVVSCAANDRATLVTWTPAQGWHVAEAERGPARDVKVEFEGPGGKSELRVRCNGGVAVQHHSGGGDD